MLRPRTVHASEFEVEPETLRPSDPHSFPYISAIWESPAAHCVRGCRLASWRLFEETWAVGGEQHSALSSTARLQWGTWEMQSRSQAKAQCWSARRPPLLELAQLAPSLLGRPRMVPCRHGLLSGIPKLSSRNSLRPWLQLVRIITKRVFEGARAVWPCSV